MQIVKEENGKIYLMQTKEIESPYSELSTKILSFLSKKPSYPKEMAKAMKENEQKVYYHVRNLEKSGIIKVARKQDIGGAVAKYYALAKPSFFVKFGDFEEGRKVPPANKFIEPFVEDGRINCRIVVGSPDPHGPEKARARDAYYAVDLALFLGSFAHKASPAVILDVEMKSDDLRNNLILIGGIVTNKVSKILNDKLPIRFDSSKNIYSSLSRKTYKTDDAGIIVKMQNPFDKSKYIMLLAGKRHSGTRAAILAVVNKLGEMQKGSRKTDAKVVEGLDTDYDGVIDDVRILE